MTTMKLSYKRPLGYLLTLLALLIIANPGWAQSLPGNNTTNFPMIGLVRGQTLQINLVAIPTDPCFAHLGFQNSSGTPVGPAVNVALQPGQSASLAINGNTLTNVPGQRVEVLPTVTFTPGTAAGQCNASAEVYDDVFGISSVFVPGSVGWPPDPIFGLLGVTELQTVRLNVVAFPPSPCVGQLSFVNSNGAPVGNTLNVQLAPGQAAWLDLPGSTLVTQLGQRAEVRPIVISADGDGVPNGGCVASAEVYVNGLGVTSIFYPPGPCGPSSSSCTAF
jgi:hypothetical protein